MKKLFFILLAAAIVALPVTVSCRKVELPPQEEVGEETEEPEGPETPEQPDPDPQNGGSNPGNTPDPGNGGNNGGGNSGGDNGGGNTGGGNGGNGDNNGDNGGNGGNGNGGGGNGGGNGGGDNGGSGNGGSGNGGNGNGGNGDNNGGSGNNNGSNTNENPIANAKVLHSWTVDFCIVEISGNGISLTAGFIGCDIEEIARMAERNGAKIDFSKIAGYKMSEISLYDNNVLAINFENKEVFYGKYALSGKNIVYTFTSGGKDLAGINASGTLTYPTAKEAVLTLKTTIKEYSGSVELDMTEK